MNWGFVRSASFLFVDFLSSAGLLAGLSSRKFFFIDLISLALDLTIDRIYFSSNVVLRGVAANSLKSAGLTSVLSDLLVFDTYFFNSSVFFLTNFFIYFSALMK